MATAAMVELVAARAAAALVVAASGAAAMEVGVLGVAMVAMAAAWEGGAWVVAVRGVARRVAQGQEE